MAKRILIADDSAVVRGFLVRLLEGDPRFELTGIAHDGQAAVDRVRRGEYDAAILDVEMPRMNGLEALTAIRDIAPRLPVLMFSQHTERGARIAIDALARGAADYVTKPSARLRDLSTKQVTQDLLEKLAAVTQGTPPGTLIPTLRPRPPLRGQRPPEVIVLATSTGGPRALDVVLRGLPAWLPVPVLVVQHMPALFTRHLADRLDEVTPLRVMEAVDGRLIEPGTVYVAPGDRHLRVLRIGETRRLRVVDDAPVQGCRPSADVLFSSASDAWGKGVLAAVLTGMGRDGTAGSRRVVEGGGRVLAQDQSSSAVWGMPGQVVKEGLVEAVVPLDDMARALVARIITGQQRERIEERASDGRR